MRLICVMLACGGLLVAPLQQVSAGGDEPGSLLRAMFEAARTRDLERLNALEAAATSATDHHGYHIARYMADPDSYADRFIDEFPDDAAGIMGSVYKIELMKGKDGRRLTPSFLYSFDQLGVLAELGNRAAARKLYLVAISSDGVVTDFVCGRTIAALTSRTTIGLGELARLSIEQRRRWYSCLSSTSTTEANALKIAVREHLDGVDGASARGVLAALENYP